MAKNKTKIDDEAVSTVRKDYERLKTDRTSWIEAAKRAAQYTIPSIAPEDTTRSRTKKRTAQPNQSVGADGINNLATKVTTTLLPPNQTFFKFKMDKASIKQAAEVEGVEEEEYTSTVNTGLANLETMLLDYMESLSDRVCLGEAMKFLYITGNVLLVFEQDKGLKYYPLERFVIKRDYCGNPMKVISEEKISFNELPEKFQDKIIQKHLEEMIDEGENKTKLEEKEFTLFTSYQLLKGCWQVFQEVDGLKLEGSDGIYPKGICPFIALRYVRVDGESYGRGLIEDYYGDISYLDSLSLAIKQSALGASKLLMLVNPNGVTKIRKLAAAPNGAFVDGRPDDVAPLQIQKYADLQTAMTTAEKIEQRLNRVFCMKAAIQRNAERVTAEEIREMAAALEESLGNHYALMAKEFQRAYVTLAYYHLRKSKKAAIPDILKSKDIKLTITTGLEALGRTSDLNKYVTFFDVMTKLAQSAQVVGAKTEKLVEVVAASLNLDVNGLFYTEEEKAQMQQQAQEAELIHRTAPNIVNKAGDMIMQQQESEAVAE